MEPVFQAIIIVVIAAAAAATVYKTVPGMRASARTPDKLPAPVRYSSWAWRPRCMPRCR